MADSADRTEKATPQRKEKARKEGQVARSADLNGAVVLAAGLVALAVFGGRFVAASEEMIREAFMAIATPGVVSREGLASLLGGGAKAAALAVAPVAFASMIAGVVVNVAQVGLKPAPAGIKPQPKRINPLQGAKNLFGPQGLFEGGKSIVKVVAVGSIAALALFPRIPELAALVGISPAELASELVRHVREIAIYAVAAYLVIAFVDIFWQRKRHEKQLRMSKDEVKREHKDQELPGEVRSAMRRRAAMAARGRMMADVPTADVVVTNPTHFAVALRYDGRSPAPVAVAKGRNLVALRIREIAREHGVPVVEDPPLARSLYAEVEPGAQIPESLYQAVAHVLAFVYRQAGRRAVA